MENGSIPVVSKAGCVAMATSKQRAFSEGTTGLPAVLIGSGYLREASADLRAARTGRPRPEQIDAAADFYLMMS